MGKTADLQLGNGVTGVGYGDAGGGILHIAELSKYADIYIYKSRCQIIVIPGVIKLFYQDYAHIPWKHKFIYNSLYNKHGG